MNNSFIKKCGAAVCITGLCGALLLAPVALAAQRPDTITVSQTAIEEENGFFSDLFGGLFGSSKKSRIEADENGVYHYVVSDGKYQAFEPGVAQAGNEWFFVEDDGITIRTFAPGVAQVGDARFYVDDNGYAFKKFTPGFAQAGGATYHIEDDGYSITSYTPGFVQVGDSIYHVEQDGYTFTNVPAGFTWLEGYRCYGSGDGSSLKLFTPGFVTVDGGIYRVSGNGYTFECTEPGLYNIGTDLYYVPSQGAAFLTNGTVGYLQFGADGRYTSGNAELDEYVSKELAACTDSSMTREQKLRAAYVYIRDHAKYLARDHHPRGDTSWTEESALFFLKNHRGNCYCFAGTFLYMSRQLGYQSYPISGGVGHANSDHAWVMIPSSSGVDYIYDVELEYAYRYRYSPTKNLNLYRMSPSNTVFIYHFPR